MGSISLSSAAGAFVFMSRARIHKENLVVIPLSVWNDKNLTHLDKLVYGQTSLMEGPYSEDDISALLNLPVTAVKHALIKLVERKHLELQA